MEERIDELTNEFLNNMERRVNMHGTEKIKEDLNIEYRKIIQEFIKVYPSIFEKYGNILSEEIMNVNDMNDLIDFSVVSITQRVYDRVTLVKRAIEKGENIRDIKNKQEPEKTEQDYGRIVKIQDKLQEYMRQIEMIIQKDKINIDIYLLKGYCNRLVNRHAEVTERDVFESDEKQMIEQELSMYIEQMEQALGSREKEEIHELQFEDGEVCPVVTSFEEFAKSTKQIIEKIEEREEIEEDRSLPGNIIL